MEWNFWKSEPESKLKLKTVSKSESKRNWMKIAGIATWIPSRPWFLWFFPTNYPRWLYSNTTDFGIPKRVRCFQLASFNTSIVWIVRIEYLAFRFVLNSRIALTHKRNHSIVVNQVLVCLLVLYCKDLKTVCKIALHSEWTRRRQWQSYTLLAFLCIWKGRDSDDMKWE